jgi:hypothetical protein
MLPAERLEPGERVRCGRITNKHLALLAAVVVVALIVVARRRVLFE